MFRPCPYSMSTQSFTRTNWNMSNCKNRLLCDNVKKNMVIFMTKNYVQIAYTSAIMMSMFSFLSPFKEVFFISLFHCKSLQWAPCHSGL